MTTKEAIEVLKEYVEKSKEWHMMSNYKKENGIRDEAIETLINRVEKVETVIKKWENIKKAKMEV